MQNVTLKNMKIAQKQRRHHGVDKSEYVHLTFAKNCFCAWCKFNEFLHMYNVRVEEIKRVGHVSSLQNTDI